jgi:hypothetical protein
VLALNAELIVYNALDMFNDAVCDVVTNEPVSALVTNDAVSALVRNDDVSALVKNDAVASFIALMDPVKYSKLPSSSSWVNGAPFIERSVKSAIYGVYV